MWLMNQSNASTLYVTLSEEWYGGHDDPSRPSPLRVFTGKDDAEEFAASYGKHYGVDVIVVESRECFLVNGIDDGSFKVTDYGDD